MSRLPVILGVLLIPSIVLADPNAGFNAGKAVGQESISTIQSNIGKNTDVIPMYGTTPPEASYFQGGKGSLSPYGVAKVQTCATGAHDPKSISGQECEAVNLLANNPNVRPHFNISSNDPMFKKARDIQNNAPELFAQYFPGFANGSSSQCTIKTITTPPSYTTETCSNVMQVGVDQCTMGRIIDIDADSNFQCEQTINAYETLKCRKIYNVNCTGGGTGCAPSGIRTTGVSISGFGNFLVHPAGGGYYYLSVGTIKPDGSWQNNYMFRGTFYNIFESNTYFDIVDKGNIVTFFLNETLYDDNIAIWLNNVLVYHSTGGTDWIKCKVAYTDYDGYVYYRDGVSDGVRSCSTSYFEGGATIRNYSGRELKGYLIEGRNHIKIKVVVGKNGDAIARFKTLAYCPLNCTTSINNECSALEVRAQ